MSKICVITGGSAGIGLASNQLFVQQGYRVFNLDLQSADSGEFIQCNICDAKEVEASIQQVLDNTGRIDVLVCNAGMHFSGDLEHTSEAELDQVLQLNVKGAYYCLRAVLPIMRQQQKGHIILMGSDQSLIAKTNSFAYNISKAALASMAKTTALDYASHGIRANAVCPGTIETPLYHKAIDRYCAASGADKEQVHAEEAAQQPVGRVGQPEEVAELVCFLASGKADFITGSLQVIDGGYTTG